MSLSAPYDKLPFLLQGTLIKSHIEAEKGWKGLTIDQYLKMRDDDGTLDVIKAVYSRATTASSFWL